VMDVPSNFTLHYSAQAISSRVKELGVEISKWAEHVLLETGKDLLVIPLLRGGLFFFADLVREIRTSVEIAPLKLSTYNPATNTKASTSSGLNIEDFQFKGRHVLVLDDICDSGQTLHDLTESSKDFGANELRTAVLIWRRLGNELFSPNWVGFEYTGKEWFVGYGMDDRDQWRNLPAIYLINQGK